VWGGGRRRVVGGLWRGDRGRTDLGRWVGEASLEVRASVFPFRWSGKGRGTGGMLESESSCLGFGRLDERASGCLYVWLWERRNSIRYRRSWSAIAVQNPEI